MICDMNKFKTTFISIFASFSQLAKMKKLSSRLGFLIFGLAWAAIGVGCLHPTTAEAPYPLPKPLNWANPISWYADSNPLHENGVDIFYVASTDVMSARDATGAVSPFAALTSNDCQAILREIDWFRQNIYTREFNFFAPLYHQVTFEALGCPKGGRSPTWDAAAEEVCEAFDYYINHFNGHRRFILAGFSQGASILRAILKHMTDEQYARCIAAYSIGFQVTADDLASPHIRPAQSATDQGVIISFNSVTKLSGKMDLLSNRAACSINPVNWRTDATPAPFQVNGQNLTATLDPTHHLVIVNGFTPDPSAFSRYFPTGNLHTYERILYAQTLRENALLRAQAAAGAK